MIGGEMRGDASVGRWPNVDSAIFPALTLVACWSWIGTAVPVGIAVLTDGAEAGSIVSIAALTLNVAMLAVCAFIRSFLNRDLPSPTARGLVVAALALATIVARSISCEAAFDTLFALATLASSFAVMGCLLVSLDLIASLEGSPIPLLASSFAISALVNMTITLLPFEIRMYTGLILACMACLFSSLAASHAPKSGEVSLASCTPAIMKRLLRPAIGSFLYGLASMGMWYISLGRSDLSSRDEATIIQSLAICLFFVAIIVIDCFGTARGKRLLESMFQRLVFAAYVIGTMLFSLVLQASPVLSTLLTMSATALFEMTLFYFSVIWGRSVSRGATACLATLLGSLMTGQVIAWWCLGGPARVLLDSIDPMIIGYACLALLLPAALAVFIPMDINGGAIGDDSSAPEGMQPDEAPDPSQVSFDDFCRTYGLSPRESQVAELLAAGRSLPYIQDALSISEGTAKTHLRHIYDKTGTHHRQDFLSLVQDISVTTCENTQS